LTAASSVRQRRLALIAWIAVCLIWGTTYLGIRITLESMPPWLMGGLRWTIAGGLLALYMRARRALPPRSDWRGILLLGFLMLVLGNGGVVWAELSSRAADRGHRRLVTVLDGGRRSAARRRRAPDRAHRAGCSSGSRESCADLAGSAAGGPAAARSSRACSRCRSPASGGRSARRTRGGTRGRPKRLQRHRAQMLAGGSMMLAIGTAQGEWTSLRFSPRALAAFVYLATVGAIGGFVAYTYALRHLPVSLVSLYAYINPIIAVALGVVVLGEPFTSRMAVAAALVFGGVAIVRTSGQTLRPLINRTRKSTIAMTRST
jgi:drug/metabolite transporter (DMT)-like permease